MRPAILILAVLLGLVGSAEPSRAAPGRAAPASPAQRTPPQQSEENEETPQLAPRSGSGQNGARAGERRRRSYASCNRDSHKRNLRGGSRRRFLIRCKLGYERRQPAHPVEPPPGRRS